MIDNFNTIPFGYKQNRKRKISQTDTMPTKIYHDVVVFYGQDSTFSNLARCEFHEKYGGDGAKFNSVEQFFQYKKAKTFGNNELAQTILQEKDNYKIKRLGGGIL